MSNLLSRLAALERRLTHSTGPTMRIYFADGSNRTVSVGDAIDLFKTGEAVKAESASGRNGMLADLLTNLAEIQ